MTLRLYGRGSAGTPKYSAYSVDRRVSLAAIRGGVIETKWSFLEGGLEGLKDSWANKRDTGKLAGNAVLLDYIPSALPTVGDMLQQYCRCIVVSEWRTSRTSMIFACFMQMPALKGCLNSTGDRPSHGCAPTTKGQSARRALKRTIWIHGIIRSAELL